MIQKIRYILLTTIIVSLIVVNASMCFAAPTIDQITLDPDIPKPMSTVTFTVTISDHETVDSVYLIIEECKSGFCYIDPDSNKTMDKKTDGEYQLEVTLGHDDANEIKYHVEVKSNGDWSSTSITEIDLDTSSSSNDNSNNGSGSTPGFELIFSLMAIIIGVILFRRKRL